MPDESKKDFLTGFSTRDTLEAFLKVSIENAKPEGEGITIAMMDVNRFKQYNDRFGHAFGDSVLKYIASSLRLSLESDKCRIFRWGGDEFVAVFSDKSSEDVFKLLRQCSYNLANRPFLCNNKLFKVSISSGIANYPNDAKDMGSLLAKADNAMYFSKHSHHGIPTQVRRLPLLRARKIAIKALAACAVVLFCYMMYIYAVEDYLGLFKKTVKEVKMIRTLQTVDILILKDQSIIEGNIVSETTDHVIFDINLAQGQGHVIFNKSEIERIERDVPISADEPDQAQE